MKCNNCGKELNDGAVFCSGCGAKISEKVSSSLNADNKHTSDSLTVEKLKRIIIILSIIVGIAVVGVVVLIIIDVRIKSDNSSSSNSTVLNVSSDNISYSNVDNSATDVKSINANVTLNASASSELIEKRETNSAGNVIDGNLSQAWVEGVQGQGIGESVTIRFDGMYKVEGCRINAGYHKSEDLYYKNSRPNEIEINFSDGTSEKLTLEDKMEIQDLRFTKSHNTSYIQIIIKSVYPGSQYEDTAISEVSLY